MSLQLEPLNPDPKVELEPLKADPKLKLEPLKPDPKMELEPLSPDKPPGIMDKVFPNMPSGGNAWSWTKGAFESAPAIASGFGSFPLGVAAGVGASLGGADLREATDEMGKTMEKYTYKPYSPEGKYITASTMEAIEPVLGLAGEASRNVSQMVSKSPFGVLAKKFLPEGAVEFGTEQLAFLKGVSLPHKAMKIGKAYREAIPKDYKPEAFKPIDVSEVNKVYKEIFPRSDNESVIITKEDNANKAAREIKEIEIRKEDDVPLKWEVIEPADVRELIEVEIKAEEQRIIEEAKAVDETVSSINRFREEKNEVGETNYKDSNGNNIEGVPDKPLPQELVGYLSDMLQRGIADRRVFFNQFDANRVLNLVENKELFTLTEKDGLFYIESKLPSSDTSRSSAISTYLQDVRDEGSNALPIEQKRRRFHIETDSKGRKVAIPLDEEGNLPVQDERVKKMNTLTKEQREEYKKAVSEVENYLDTDKVMQEFDALPYEHQLANYERLLNIDKTTEPPSPESLARAQAAAAIANASGEARLLEQMAQKKKYVDDLIASGKYTQEQLSTMTDKSIAQLHNMLGKKSTDVLQQSAEDLAKMSEAERVLGEIVDRERRGEEVPPEELAAALEAWRKTEMANPDSPLAALEGKVDPEGVSLESYDAIKEKRLLKQIAVNELKMKFLERAQALISEDTLKAKESKTPVKEDKVTQRRRKKVEEEVRGKGPVIFMKDGVEKTMNMGGVIVGDKFVSVDAGSLSQNRGPGGATFGVYDKAGREIAGGFETATEATAHAKTLTPPPPPADKVAVRRRQTKAKEVEKTPEQIALDKVIAEQERDRIAQEQGMMLDEDTISIEEIRRREERGYGENDTYDWSDRMTSKEAPPLTYEQLSMKAGLIHQELMSKGTWTEGDGRNALSAVYKIKPTIETRSSWIKKVIETEKRFEKEGKYHEVSRFNRRGLDLAEQLGDITPAERVFIETNIKMLRKQPSFSLEIKEDLGKDVIGTYEFMRNLMELKDPKSITHELLHYAWFNVLTGAERIKYINYYKDTFVTDSKRLNSFRQRAYTSDFINAPKNPSEMFAALGADYAHRFVLHPTEASLFRKVFQWFDSLMGKLSEKIIDYEPVKQLFDKVMDDSRRSFWAGDAKINADPIDVVFLDRLDAMAPRAVTNDMTVFQGTNRIVKEFLDKYLLSGTGLHEQGYGHYFTSTEVGGKAWAEMVQLAKGGDRVLNKAILPDDLNLLDLNRPITNAQRYTIADALRRVELEGATTKKVSAVEDLISSLEEGIVSHWGPTGSDIQNSLSRLFGKKETSAFLRDECGIQGSVFINHPKFGNNYVIFSEKVPKLLSSETLDMLGLQQMYERAKTILKNALPAKELSGNSISSELKGPNEEGRIKQIQTNPKSEDSIKAWKALMYNPQSLFKGTAVEPHWFSLNGAELKYSFHHDQNLMTIRDIFRGMSEAETLNVRKVMEGKMTGNVNEQAAAVRTREYFDAMKGRIKAFLLDDFRRGLNDNEYNAIMDLVDGKHINDVAKKYPMIDRKTIEEIKGNYDSVTKWGIDDYIPNYEFGRIKLMAQGPDGYELIAMGLSVRDAVRKGVKYLKENPNHIGDLYVDTSATKMFDDRTTIGRSQYHAMERDFQKKIKETIQDIDAGFAKQLAKTTLEKKFKVQPTSVYAPYLEPRRNVLRGEENIRDVMHHYSYIMEKKMALDPVIDDIRHAINKGEFDRSETKAILSLVEDVKGKYWWEDRFLDSVISSLNKPIKSMEWMPKILPEFEDPHGTASRYSRRMRAVEANLKLGYRPNAALINLISGQAHTWTKAGSHWWNEGRKFLGTEEGKKFIKEIEPYLGTSVTERTTGGLRSTTEAWKPLGLFQKSEPFNREMSAASYYTMAKAQGLSEGAAFQGALRATWTQQFCYNMASLPQFMRSPGARMVTQFMPYLTNELAFMKNLSPKEWVRYLSWNLALTGTRGTMTLMKTIPLLAAIPAFRMAMDEIDGYMNANHPEWHRGVPGMLEFVSKGLGSDLSGPGSFQLPTSMVYGAHLNTLYHIYEDFAKPWWDYGFKASTLKFRAGGEAMSPAFREWIKIVDYLRTPGEGHVLNSKGTSVRKVPKVYDEGKINPEALFFLAQKGLTTEGLIESQARVADTIGQRIEKKLGDAQDMVEDRVAFDLLQGRQPSNEDIQLMIKYKASISAPLNRTILNNIPPQYRMFFKKNSDYEMMLEKYKLHTGEGEQESYD